MKPSGSGKPSSRLPWPKICAGAGIARWAAVGTWMRQRYCRRIRRAAREGAAIEARSGTILLLTALIPLCDAASARGPSPPSPVQRIRRQYQTYVKVKGRWTYFYRAVDSRGQTIDFLLSAKRDAAAAQRFFRKALGQPHTVNPRTITVDKNAAYPAAVTAMKRDRELWRFSRLRQVKYLNNIVEQDHRRIKRLVRPGLGFGSLPTARRTLAGYEGIAMIRKGQVRNIGGGEMRAQAAFVAGLFGIAA